MTTEHELKVQNLSGDTWQVVRTMSNCVDYYVCYQGSLSDCEAYMRLKIADLLL